MFKIYFYITKNFLLIVLKSIIHLDSDSKMLLDFLRLLYDDISMEISNYNNRNKGLK